MRKRFSALVGGAAVLASSAGLAGTAAAATPADATTTAVTSVTTPFSLYDDDTTTGNPTIHLAGTSDGVDAVLDLRCYQGTSDAASGNWGTATTDDNGNWTADVPESSIEGDLACIARAIPQVSGSSQSPTDFTKFTGKVVGVAEVQRDYNGSQADPYDYYVEAGNASGYMDYDSVGGCGLDDGKLTDPTDESAGGYEYYCNDYAWYDNAIDTSTSTVNKRSSLVVDGKEALVPAEYYYLYDDNHVTVPANAPTLAHNSFVVTQNHTTGALTIAETDPLVLCKGGTAYPLTTDECTTWAYAGVSVHRVISQSASGRVASFKDTYISTDGKAHTVSLDMENDMSGSSYTWNASWADGSTYKTHVAGDTIGAAPFGPATLLWQTTPTGSPSINAPVGSITFSSAPSRIIFYDNGGFYVDHTKSIPAGGSSSLTTTYAAGTSLAEVQAAAAAARAAAPRGVSLNPTKAQAVKYGAAVTYSGLVTDDGVHAPAGVPVALYETTPTGRVTLAAVKTTSAGTWSVAVHPFWNGSVYAQVAQINASSSRRSVAVAPTPSSISESYSAGRVHVTVAMAPGHPVSSSAPWVGALDLTDSTGKVVRVLTHADAGKWVTSSSNRRGTNTFSFSFAAAAGTYHLAVAVPATAYSAASVTDFSYRAA